MDFIIKVSNNPIINWYNNYAYTVFNTGRYKYIPIFDCFKMFTATVPEFVNNPEYNTFAGQSLTKSNHLNMAKYDKDTQKFIHDLNDIVSQHGLIQFIPQFPLHLTYGTDMLSWAFYVADEKRQKRPFYSFTEQKEIEYYKLETKCKYLVYNTYTMIELSCSQYSFSVLFTNGNETITIPHRSVFFKMFNEIKSVQPSLCDILIPKIVSNISANVTKYIGRSPDENTNFFLHHQFVLSSKNDFMLNTDENDSLDLVDLNDSPNSVNTVMHTVELNKPFIWFTRMNNFILSMGIFD